MFGGRVEGQGTPRAQGLGYAEAKGDHREHRESVCESEHHPFKVLNLAGSYPGSRLLLLLLSPNRHISSKTGHIALRAWLGVRVPWGQW